MRSIISLATALRQNEWQNESRTMRQGKTERDRLSGAHRRNENNKLLRGNWENERTSHSTSNIPFPIQSVAGKRHRPHSFKMGRKGGVRKRA